MMRRVAGILFLCVASFWCSYTAHANAVVLLDTPEAAMDLTERIMGKVADDNIESAIFLMRPFFRLPDAEFKILLEQSKLQIPMIKSRFGTPLEHELIEQRFIGKSLMRIVHLQKYKYHAMRWMFVFYNPDGSWYINSFNFDDKIKELF
jgi:hypothetical protein